MTGDAIEPWQDTQTLASIGRLLYPRGENEDDDRKGCQHAIAVIRSWQRRTQGPQAIISTALLVDACIYHRLHQQEPSSKWTIRDKYALAFARFVTGFCEGPSSKPGVSMYEVAQRLAMPAKWVDVRHNITHGQIPDLRALEALIRPALEWLWYGFWVHFCDAEKGEQGERGTQGGKKDTKLSEFEELDSLREAIKELLRDYCAQRKVEIADGQEPFAAVTDFQEKFCEICGPDVKRWNTAARLLVDTTSLFRPSETGAALDMDASRMICDHLIASWAEGSMAKEKRRLLQSFVGRLISALLRRVCEPLIHMPSLYAKFKWRQEAATDWLCHVLEPGSPWLAPAHDYLSKNEDAIMEALLMESTACCARVAWALIDRGSTAFQDKWRPLCDAVSTAYQRPQAISRISRAQPVDDKMDMDIELPALMEESEAHRFLQNGADDEATHSKEDRSGWRLDNGYRMRSSAATTVS